MEQIVIVIPAYEPDNRLLKLLTDLKENEVGPVILVNDGSSFEYREIFFEASEIIKEEGGELLVHQVNKGKGRALKTAFHYVLDNYSDAIGVITADSDGQHTVEAIKEIKKALLKKSDNLILGVRKFDGHGIPWKSRFGNSLTEKVFMFLTGIHVSDTQTGLRGIPKPFLQHLLDLKGERFEFEMQMLLESVGKYDITEISIEAVYDSKKNHQTHFEPIMDSVRIYKILGGRFFKYIFTSFSSSMIDLGLFLVFCVILKHFYPRAYIIFATGFARIISAIYNYIMNYKMVFCSNGTVGKTAVRYSVLAVIQMCLSAVLVTFLINLFKIVPEIFFKIVVDTVLFFISYYVQRKYIFD